MSLVEEISGYGGKLIISGGDYGVEYFTARQLYDICTNKINNIWYYYEKMHPCRLRLEISKINGDFVAKELKETPMLIASATR